MYRLVAEDPFDPTQHISVDFYLLKLKQIEKGKIYEFLGEVEQIKKTLTGAPESGQASQVDQKSSAVKDKN